MGIMGTVWELQAVARNYKQLAGKYPRIMGITCSISLWAVSRNYGQ